MNFSAPSKHDFDKITDYVDDNHIKLLVLDFNGVLDDYYSKKVTFLKDILGEDNEQRLPELILFIERAYIADRSATIERSFEAYLRSVDVQFTERQRHLLTNSMFTSSITEDAKHFLDSLKVQFVIYTALSEEQISRSIGINTYDCFTRGQYQEPKPSTANLISIMKLYDAEPHETCVVGDGLIDDLMPAALLGMHTILVSPYAGMLVQPIER